MITRKNVLTLAGSAQTDIFDVTPKAQDFVRGSGISEGHFVVFVPGSTAAVTTIEYESGVVEDLAEAIERLIPSEIPYKHNLRWGDGNGYAHVRAAFLKPSLTFPVWDGKIILGTWQQIVLIDFDNRPRQRTLIFHLMGE